MTTDSQAITLLCAPIAVGETKPLTIAEWARLGAAIHASEIRHPGALVGLSAVEVVDELAIELAVAERITSSSTEVAHSRSSSSV